YSYRKECAVVLERIATASPDCVIALPPSGLRDAFLRVIRRVPCVSVAVHDTPENILERITFYDIDSRPIDKHLTDEEQALYLKESRPTFSFSRRAWGGPGLHAPTPALAPGPGGAPPAAGGGGTWRRGDAPAAGGAPPARVVPMSPLPRRSRWKVNK